MGRFCNESLNNHAISLECRVLSSKLSCRPSPSLTRSFWTQTQREQVRERDNVNTNNNSECVIEREQAFTYMKSWRVKLVRAVCGKREAPSYKQAHQHLLSSYIPKLIKCYLTTLNGKRVRKMTRVVCSKSMAARCFTYLTTLNGSQGCTNNFAWYKQWNWQKAQ